MARRLLEDIEHEAKLRGVRPPKRRGNKPPTSPLQMALRRQAMVQLVSMGASDDEIDATMLERFPEMAPTALGKLRAEALAIINATMLETPVYERAKQKTRLMRQIMRAERKESWSAVFSGERLYADVAGTIAPTTVNINHNVVPAFQVAMARLGEAQLRQLAAGEDAPLGGALETTAEPVVEADDGGD